ncbi:helix-turn-helix domain-containing protein [Sediminibacterium roseum]|uniref:Helix-turn-helix domain-containing protein n=1 Tax=Sediminibacterium roseum TaxID=1978412 RepID=A0ABW9ZUY4_9BACT|nr:helix-turn-helix domain-containing protein [Sediminibacterium roseum]NCI50956.1 helix-turn-helix domain-containing protein [Sediminibacterium roseum]
MQEKQTAAIAKLVKQRRIERNLTQQQLADLTGLSLRSVQRVEKAEAISRSYTLEVLGKHLGLGETFQQILSMPAAGEEDSARAGGGSSQPTGISKGRKILLSISSALLITLVILAYVFQSAGFPETAFELMLLLAGALLVYTGVMYLIWR